MSAQLLTAPAVGVIRDAGHHNDDRVRLASREGFFPHKGLKVTLDHHCLSTDTELEVLLDNTVIVQHIVTAAELHSPLTIHVGPEHLTKDLHELNYRVKRNNQAFQTCDQPVTVHIVIKTMDDLGPDDGTTPYCGSFAQIGISYPKDKKNACFLTEPTNEKVKYLLGAGDPILADDYLYVIDSNTRDVVIYYASSLERRATLPTPFTSTKLGGVSPDLLYSYVYDSYRTQILRIGNNGQHDSIDFEDFLRVVLLNKAGDRLYVASKSYLEVRAAPSGESLNLAIPFDNNITDLALHPNGRYLYASTYYYEGGTPYTKIYVLRTHSLSTLSLITLSGIADKIVISPDGSRLYTAAEFTGEISLIDTATNKTIKVSKSTLQPYNIGVSADGKHVYVTEIAKASIWVLDSESLDIVRTIEGGRSLMRGLLGAPDDTLFVAHL